MYGDRIPKGFEKVDLLGKGGCALVWMAKDIESGERVAVKQFPKKQDISSGKTEATVNSILFDNLDISKEEFPGIDNICGYLGEIDESKDYWIIFEIGGSCLTKNLFEVKGEFYKNERIYFAKHQEFYYAVKSNKNLLKDFLRRMFESFDLLQALGIVHADIKPDNILVDFDGTKIKSLKLIDFGSAFSFEEASSIAMSTPEYLAPEVLEYLDNRGRAGGAQNMLKNQ